ncbi:MAG: rod shape-determining protein RodA [Kosmotoga sp.]|uniref:FtsW/RodA/SpoVE family cell cycle protein n=1 Tax=Kosmotoga sp. TaxID=1955248 RepID=UPI001E12B5F7|nr:FtsW/RodA/SpoVE family cell cycle protein [Kosmotoga sp.]MBO8165910.1 rod shape-determining protein RodA [Kosmotoga sp.]
MRKGVKLFLPFNLVALMFFGLLAIFSATYGNRFSGLFYRQLFWDALAFSVFLVVSRLSFRFWKAIATWLLLLSLLLLVIVLLLPPVSGSRRWIDFGVASFQPSEVAKFVIILFLAKIYSESRKNFYIGVAITALLAFLIYKEPDLGMTMMILGIWFFITFFSRRFDKWILIVLIVGLVILPLLLFFGLEEYQMNRILSFMNPEKYASSSAYNTVQAIRAIGSGGFTGKGLLLGVMNRYGYVPEDHTDFIFSVIGEELGFVGTLTLLMLYSLLMLNIWKATKRAPDMFSYLVSAGIMITFFMHITENIGMNLGLMPVTGIPLPFVSYGGSSVMIFAAQLGMTYRLLADNIEAKLISNEI